MSSKLRKALDFSSFCSRTSKPGAAGLEHGTPVSVGLIDQMLAYGDAVSKSEKRALSRHEEVRYQPVAEAMAGRSMS